MGNTVSAAEQAIALLFATARNIARADALMQKGQWEKKTLVGSEVFEKTLGLIGLGKIGGHVAAVMRAAGMKLLAYDPFLPPDRARQMGVELVEVDELLARSDFVTIHTPLTDKTRNLLDATRLKKMKKGARLVNCARGGIVDEAALAEAVKSGHLAAAGIDVFSKEPMTEGPLFGVKDLTLTPHLGASTEEAEERCGLQMAEQVVAFFRRGEIRNAVNVSVSADPELKPYAAAARAMGTLAATLLDAAPQTIEIGCAGEIAAKDTAIVSSAAVEGLLSTFGPEDVNVVNAAWFAKQRGIEVRQASGLDAGAYRSRVSVSLSGGGRTVRIEGTAYDGRSPRIVRVDEFEVDLRPEGNLLLLLYPDRPGYVGRFGTILGSREINIASMEVGRTGKSGRALMAIALDEKPAEAVLRELKAVEGVSAVHHLAI